MVGYLVCRVYEVSNEKVKGLEVDALARLTMTYTAEGFNELKADVEKNGQLVPVITREGKILDGRHRHQVAISLGINLVCKEVGNIDDSTALDIVISNSINKATSSDASKTEAYLICKAKGIANKDMPSVFSRLNSNYVSKLSFIDKENPEYLNILLHQNMVTLYNKEYNKIEDYGTINSLWRTLKGNKKLDDRVIEVVPEPVQSKNYTVNVTEYFDNDRAEKEYWDLYEVGKCSGVNLGISSELGSKVAALVKGKYL